MRYLFNGFELNECRAELIAPDGAQVNLVGKPFDLLVHLIQHRDQVASRDDLLTAIWADTIVGDGSLSTAIKHIRKALDRGPGAAEAIRTIPRRGYRFVATVKVATALEDSHHPANASPSGDGGHHRAETDLPAPLHAPPCPTGRQREQQALQTQLVKALADTHAGAVLLQGPEGLGKGEIVRHALQSLSLSKTATVHVRCEQTPGAPALWPFVQVLRQLVGAIPDAQRQLRDRHAATEIGRLLHAMQIPYDPESSSARTDASSARFLLFDAVTQALTTALTRSPIFIFIEDIQWCDSSSRELLRFMAPQLESTGRMIIATFAPQPTLPTFELPGSATIEIGPLSPQAARGVLTQATTTAIPEDRVNAIIEASAGNPSLLREFARAEERHAASACDRPKSTPPPLPLSYQDMVRARLDRLTPASQKLLQIAACLGYEFDSARVERCLTSTVSVTPLLDEARRAAFLIRVPHTARRYRFENAMLRSAVYGSFSADILATWHGLIAEHIEQDFQGDEDRLGELVRHFASAHKPVQLAKYANQAACYAGSIGAYDTANEHLSLTAPKPRPLVVDAASRIELVLQTAAAKSVQGAPTDEPQRLFRRAFDLASDLRSPELLARSALGFSGCQLYRGAPLNAAPPTREELSLLGRALAEQADNSIWCVLVGARLGVALASTDQVAEGQQLTARSVHRAQALGDARTLCEALLQRSRSLCGPGEHQARLAVLDEATALAQHAGLPLLNHDSRFERACAKLRLDDLSCTEVNQLADGALADTSPVTALRGTLWAIMLAFSRGHLDRARSLMHQATTLAQHESPIVISKVMPSLDWELDRLRGAKTGLESIRAVDASRFKASLWMGYTWLFALLDRGHRRTAKALHEVLARRMSKLARNQYWLPAMGVAAWATYTFRDRPRALAVYEQLLPYESENVTATDGLLFHGPVSLYLGTAALGANELSRAWRHLDDAARRAERLDMDVPRFLARKYLSFLKMQQGDEQTARAELHQLRAELNDRGLLGLTHDL